MFSQVNVQLGKSPKILKTNGNFDDGGASPRYKLQYPMKRGILSSEERKISR
jgi:hypothetical protein